MIDGVVLEGDSRRKNKNDKKWEDEEGEIELGQKIPSMSQGDELTCVQIAISSYRAGEYDRVSAPRWSESSAKASEIRSDGMHFTKIYTSHSNPPGFKGSRYH